jgi:lipopolysaccharide/colanic/teichoic acid biosynthesis glycosyltransferase
VNTTGQRVDFGREFLLDQLYRGFGDPGYANGQFRSLRVRIKLFNRHLVIDTAMRCKRAMDIVVSSVALILLSPLFLLLAIAIRLQDGGPALFWQTRVGLWGREFRFPKFRSMVPNAEQQRMKLVADNQHGDGITFKIKRDPRITWIGGIIRKLSLDELPQLWCVLAGDMSLVGPRPPLPSEVARYALNDRRRLEVKPGLTCIWQVSGRSELSFEHQVRLDAKYIDSHSILLDISLLLKTIPAIITGRGAY